MLPEAFKVKMRHLLGDEADALFVALSQASSRGLRANTLKLCPDTLRAKFPAGSLEAVPWTNLGFHIDQDLAAGKHPMHAAGLYYLQEPSAMSVAEALAPKAGDWVLDLAAAPGGKSTHLLSLMQDDGLLVANDVNYKRCQALKQNLERFGAKNTLIMNTEISALANSWGAVFDKVLLDAPCSGEGMFRKSEAALNMWSEQTVHDCSIRQKDLITDAARLVKTGGTLAYSTCTFAPEENEQIIDTFLKQHPNYSLEHIILPSSLPAVPSWSHSNNTELTKATRLWPHLLRGEGHFVALLKRTDGDVKKIKTPKLKPINKKENQLWLEFAKGSAFEAYANQNLALYGNKLFSLPEHYLDFDNLNCLNAGLWLGNLHKSRFEPSHALALACSKEDALLVNHLNLAADDSRVSDYLAGDILEASGDKGWLLVLLDGFPLGWAKRSANVVKNAYPKGLRGRFSFFEV